MATVETAGEQTRERERSQKGRKKRRGKEMTNEREGKQRFVFSFFFSVLLG